MTQNNMSDSNQRYVVYKRLDNVNHILREYGDYEEAESDFKSNIGGSGDAYLARVVLKCESYEEDSEYD